ncbi:hypothetical protein FIBSPDRAFT_92184 [Athelia psychrophila]|uniref:Uncharacterized protein n=1 Tax=Athelia psychrophila TaxID=1759441 RepID=A0A166TK71_9AGAM|nr:hypothetical protein FIBSPDRAFT_92184 [Fibularhizoctonia sp. CBS 109695]
MQFSVALALSFGILAASVSALPVSESDLAELVNDGGAYRISLPERREEESELTKLYNDFGAYEIALPERRDEDSELTKLLNDEGAYDIAKLD